MKRPIRYIINSAKKMAISQPTFSQKTVQHEFDWSALLFISIVIILILVAFSL